VCGVIEALSAFARAGFTTRATGNFAEPLSPQALARLRAALGVGVPHRAHQVHGNGVLVVAGDGRWHPESADALIARGAPVAVRVADCLPLLLVDPRSGYLAAVHVGWRGLAAGIVQATLARLQALGVALPRLRAAIGPHIRPCCFEVGEDAAQRLAGCGCTIRRQGKASFADLAAGVRRALLDAGLSHDAIEDRSACTACEAERFFSWRARKEQARMLAVIAPRR